MIKIFAMFLIKLGDYFLKKGYDMWSARATEAEQIEYINARIKPLGVMVEKRASRKDEIEQIFEEMAIREAKRAKEGYEN